MNAPEPKPVTGLTPEAAALIDTYFSRVHGALLVAAAGECEDAVDDLRTHIIEELAGTAGTSADVTRVLSELGPPEVLAAEYADEGASESGPRRLSDVDKVPLHGKVLGVPYELRVPSTDRIAGRWWNPLDPHIFVPRVFGVGWDINFGALAVRLHLVRPDDEDVPFASVPSLVVSLTLALPVALAAVQSALMALSYGTLPAQLPVHWGASGPDNFWPRAGAVAFLAAVALVPVLLAAWVHVRRRPNLNRVAASVFATFTATLAFSQFIQTLYYARGDLSTLPTYVGVALAVLAPFVMLVSLSRVGRAEEMRRDLESTTKKGSV
jgi:hypothetical protein